MRRPLGGGAWDRPALGWVSLGGAALTLELLSEAEQVVETSTLRSTPWTRGRTSLLLLLRSCAALALPRSSRYPANSHVRHVYVVRDRHVRS